jgi:phage/plasmid primase-like uncharacterized protein
LVGRLQEGSGGELSFEQKRRRLEMYIDSKEVLAKANGRWIEILATLAPELSEAIDVADDPRKHVSCPVHGGENGDAFRLFGDVNQTGGGVCNSCGAKPNGLALLMWVKGWTYPETLKNVQDILGKVENFRRTSPRPPMPRKTTNTFDVEKQKKVLNYIWRKSLPLDHPDALIARKYLQSRGLKFPDPQALKDIRFHPRLAYYEDGQNKGNYPGLVCLFRDEKGKPITIHRIYLSPDGTKAPVANAKKMMLAATGEKINGGGIRIGTMESVIGIAEGVETAFAIRQATGLSMIATTTAVLLKQLEIPKGVKFACLWGDKDRSETGEKAILELGSRLLSEGIKIACFVPQTSIPEGKKGIDWLDILAEFGPESFPMTKTDDSVTWNLQSVF